MSTWEQFDIWGDTHKVTKHTGWVVVSARLRHGDFSVIKAEATRRGSSLAEVVREAMSEWIERHG